MSDPSGFHLFIRFIEGLIDYSPKDYDEGLGTTYERFVLYKYLSKLIREARPQSVLEGPSDGITGVRGINSLPFALNGIEVTYFTPSKREAQIVTLVWEIIRRSLKELNVNVKLWNTAIQLKFPFADNTFDLVWNFCIVEHFANRAEVIIKEMARVSKKHVLVVTQNMWNLGTVPHILYHKITRRPWDHGDVSKMRFSHIEGYFKKAGIKVVDKGMIDVPIWPDTWDTPIRGIFKKLHRKEHQWRWSIIDDPTLRMYEDKLRKYMLIENSKLHQSFKLLFAHHLYCYGVKE